MPPFSTLSRFYFPSALRFGIGLAYPQLYFRIGFVHEFCPLSASATGTAATDQLIRAEPYWSPRCRASHLCDRRNSAARPRQPQCPRESTRLTTVSIRVFKKRAIGGADGIVMTNRTVRICYVATYNFVTALGAGLAAGTGSRSGFCPEDGRRRDFSGSYLGRAAGAGPRSGDAAAAPM